MRPSQQATTGASGPAGSAAGSRATPPWAAPRRTPPSRVTTSLAPTTSRPGVGSPVRPPSMTRNGPPVTSAARALAGGLLEADLEGLGRGEVAQLQIGRRRGQTSFDRVLARRAGVVRDGQERGGGREPDELRLGEGDAVFGRQLADAVPDEPERRDGEVQDVHRHL